MNISVPKTYDELKNQLNEANVFLPYNENTRCLSEGVKVGSKEVKNRLVCQAMEGCDGTLDGKPDELTKRRYMRFAKGGAGLIWFEATAVMLEGRANKRQLFINSENLDSFKALVEDIKETALRENGFEPVVIMQATHSGRYSKPHGVPEPLIAYNNPVFEGDSPIPESRIVSDEYLDRVSESLVSASALAEKAGFDGIDIKCCHRYLNSELLSAYQREGRYGGSFENRTRLLRESVKGALENCGSDFLVTSRLNIYDGFKHPYGFGVKDDGSIDIDISESAELARILYRLGVKLLNITMGNPYFNPHVNRPYAKGGYEPDEHPLFGVARILNGASRIKFAVPDLKIICSGLSYLGANSPNVAAAYIEENKFDFAGFGRMIFAYPDFANDILKNKGLDSGKCCICCSKCTEIMRAGGTPGCVIRDREVYLPIYKNCVK